MALHPAAVLADARQVKNLPGRPKRDPSDSRWLAACFERGAITSCFVATPEFRIIREHTRYRRDLTAERTREKQRAEKLEGAAKPAHMERSAGTIKLANRGTHAKVLMALDDAAVATPDGRLLFKTGKQFICKQDRIVLLGLNGAGKTRFVAMLRQAIESGEATQTGIKVTQSLALGYCGQDLADLADADTPMHAIMSRFEVGDQRARALLAGAGLSVAMQSRPINPMTRAAIEHPLDVGIQIGRAHV